MKSCGKALISILVHAHSHKRSFEADKHLANKSKKHVERLVEGSKEKLGIDIRENRGNF